MLYCLQKVEELLVHELFVLGARNLAAQPHLHQLALVDELVEKRVAFQRMHVGAKLLLVLREQRDVFLRRTAHPQSHVFALISALDATGSHRGSRVPAFRWSVKSFVTTSEPKHQEKLASADSVSPDSGPGRYRQEYKTDGPQTARLLQTIPHFLPGGKCQRAKASAFVTIVRRVRWTRARWVPGRGLPRVR